MLLYATLGQKDQNMRKYAQAYSGLPQGPADNAGIIFGIIRLSEH